MIYALVKLAGSLYQGIETVRRDGCPLLVKMLEKVLRLLFTTKDLSQVKGYLYRQWTRILTDRAAVGDFIFAKEVSEATIHISAVLFLLSVTGP